MIIVFLLIPIFFVLFLGGVIAIVRSSGHASSGAPGAIFSVVPRPAKVAATTLLSIAVTVGVIAGSLEFRLPNGQNARFLGGFVGLLGGTFVGGLFLIWVLGLGYVYGDARRRNMPAVPWLLVALFVPNLLGFLLYFVLRKPLARPCPQCGQAITPEQRFCSWCGGLQYGAPYGTTVAPPGGVVSG
jgi:hypothetical protein